MSDSGDSTSSNDPTAGYSVSESVDDPTLNHPMVRKSLDTPARSAEQAGRSSTSSSLSAPSPLSGIEVDDDAHRPGAFARLKSWATGLVKPRTQVDVLGDRGENVAAKFLRNAGYKIIERNFRCQVGEIDIIARDGKTLVFVEVKTRVYDDPTPEEQVNGTKRHQITKAAKFYLTRYGWPQPPARFDIVAIVWPTGREPQIRHTTDAFEATF